ncbi:MAG: penicillin-binding transpeptidase domain-containing protein [Bdellovibrionales bacterium]
MKSRLLLVFMGFLLLWTAMILRGAYLQIIPNERLAGLQRRQFATKIEVSGRRGAIVDRNGRELAASVGSQSLFADPAILEQPRSVAKRLAKLLKMSRAELQKKLRQRDKRFVWIKRHMPEEAAAAIRKWEIRGLGFVDESRRVYPNNQLLAQTLGFVGTEGDGLEGLERKFNRELSGETRKVILPRDARGRPLLPEGGLLTNVNDGARVELTIDSQVQFILEKELADAVSLHQADGAVGLVMDPNTGEILGLASEPSADRRNRVITDAFEAGSVMKTFVIAAALREAVVKPSSRYNCEGGRMKVGDRWIREADAEHEFGWLTVSEILAFSSNIGTAKIAFDLGADHLRQALLDFGFGDRLQVDLPGEARGILHPLPWRSHLLSNISFGHGLAVTPLQLASAYSAIANGGLLKRPQVVKRIVQGEEETVFEPKTIRRVLSEDQAATLRLMLRAATMEHATGVNARIPGFPVAGKTGTAQKVDLEKGGYKKNAYISSFAGFVPAHAPKFVIFVAVDNPRKGYYASHVAAPVFARIAQYVVRQQGLAPVLLSEQNLLKRDQGTPTREMAQAQALAKLEDEIQAGRGELIPNLVGLTLREVYQRARASGLTVEVRGSGLVANTYPGAGAEFPSDKKVRVFLEPVE